MYVLLWNYLQLSISSLMDSLPFSISPFEYVNLPPSLFEAKPIMYFSLFCLAISTLYVMLLVFPFVRRTLKTSMIVIGLTSIFFIVRAAFIFVPKVYLTLTMYALDLLASFDAHIARLADFPIPNSSPNAVTQHYGTPAITCTILCLALAFVAAWAWPSVVKGRSSSMERSTTLSVAGDLRGLFLERL
jgi:hypothetical protein